MKKLKLFLPLLTLAVLFSVSLFKEDNNIHAQDIPELHMLVLQGDVFLPASSNKTSSLDGFLLEAKIDGTLLGSVRIGENITGRYSGLEVGPNADLEGKQISFHIGGQVAFEKEIFGPLTVAGAYCRGCTWSLPISRSLNLHFDSVPLPTPTPQPAKVEPSFLTGTLIFGSILSAPDGMNKIYAYIDDLEVGSGTVSGSDFSITIDPGVATYEGKNVVFKIGDSISKTKYTFVGDDFQTDFKLFFPEFVPTPTPTSVPVPPTATSIPSPTPTLEPTRTPTAVPEPTPTYTPTATPTAIAMSTSDLIIEEDGSGGCNSRGGGAASLSLIVLSAAPLYLLNRRKRKN